jgi:prophage regulatory protein
MISQALRHSRSRSEADETQPRTITQNVSATAWSGLRARRLTSGLQEAAMNLKEPVSQPQATEFVPQLLRLPAVLLATGLGRSTVYRMVAEHRFPAPVKLARRAVGRRHDDVRQWTLGRPSTSR